MTIKKSLNWRGAYKALNTPMGSVTQKALNAQKGTRTYITLRGQMPKAPVDLKFAQQEGRQHVTKRYYSNETGLNMLRSPQGPMTQGSPMGIEGSTETQMSYLTNTTTWWQTGSAVPQNGSLNWGNVELNTDMISGILTHNLGNTVGVFLIVALLLSAVILLASYFLAKQNPDPEKFSVYECGFDPFGDSRQKFEVRFFLVGILFIIFDLEISFLFPWSVILSNFEGPGGHLYGYYVMIVFLIILTIGLVYEWMKGGLEWE